MAKSPRPVELTAEALRVAKIFMDLDVDDRREAAELVDSIAATRNIALKAIYQARVTSSHAWVHDPHATHGLVLSLIKARARTLL